MRSLIRATLTIVVPILTLLTTLTCAAAADVRAGDRMDIDGTVHVIVDTSPNPLGVHVESDYVAPRRRPNARARTRSEREAMHGSDAFQEALVYLRQSPRASHLLGRLDHAGIRISLVINHKCHGGQRMNDGLNSLINWDPSCAYRTGNGSNSPALVLLHELVHTLHLAENPQAYLDNNGRKDTLFDSNEERVTILYGEIPVARELGEAVRTNHHENRPFSVNDPTVR